MDKWLLHCVARDRNRSAPGRAARRPRRAMARGARAGGSRHGPGGPREGRDAGRRVRGDPLAASTPASRYASRNRTRTGRGRASSPAWPKPSNPSPGPTSRRCSSGPIAASSTVRRRPSASSTACAAATISATTPILERYGRVHSRFGLETRGIEGYSQFHVDLDASARACAEAALGPPDGEQRFRAAPRLGRSLLRRGCPQRPSRGHRRRGPFRGPSRLGALDLGRGATDRRPAPWLSASPTSPNATGPGRWSAGPRTGSARPSRKSSQRRG